MPLSKSNLTSVGSGLGLIVFGVIQLIGHKPEGWTDIISGIGIITASFSSGFKI